MKAILLGMMSVTFLSIGGLQANVEDNNYTVTTEPTEKKASGYREIQTNELQDLLKKNPSITIVDARLPKHDDGNRIPGAKFIPYDTFEDTIQATLPNKEETIIVYCASIRCPVSKYMSERLVSLGYQNVVRYPEGLEGWEKSGNHVDKVTPAKPQHFDDAKDFEK